MKEKYNSLNIYYKTSLWTVVYSTIFAIVFMFLFFINLSEVPLGLLLGSVVESLLFSLQGLIEKKETDSKSIKLTIVVMVFRYLVMIGLLVLVAYVYYKNNFHYFNVFATAGGILLTYAVYIILTIRRKDDAI